MKRAAIYLFITMLALATLGADSPAAEQGRRFERLGHRLMCMCGCNQILLECNHVGCPMSDGMRNELTAAIAKNSDDKPVMETFTIKYGFVVVAAPMGGGFDRVAWIVPYAAFVLGIGLAVWLMRVWRGRMTVALPTPAPGVQLDALRDRARRESESEL